MDWEIDQFWFSAPYSFGEKTFIGGNSWARIKNTWKNKKSMEVVLRRFKSEGVLIILLIYTKNYYVILK